MKARVPKQASMGNRTQMLKQLNDAQEKMEQTQNGLNERVFESVSGGNAVKVQFNGKKEMLSINIKEEVVDPEDIEMLEDLIKAAVNSCLKDVEETSEKELSSITGGLNLPGMF
ncbi:MAG: YbaB/EbfC family nucleoid-associated protein [Oscillospiraceae bacterium]